MSWNSASVSASRRIDCAIAGRTATATIATKVMRIRSNAWGPCARCALYDGETVIADCLAPRA
ncbi:hypothetical protein GCM10009115_31330 [Sphingopyxis soli]|uniref:Uncharacterized protein n=1 Tax=Sphingopyxis soli TaxID=592051 RepID=A0ABN1MBK9_9SPHN